MVVPPTSPTRSELRSVMRDVRARFVAGLPPGEQARLNAALAARALPLLEGRTQVAGYAAMRDEIDPSLIGFEIWPRVIGNHEPLRFHHAATTDLIPAPEWGIREPRADAPLAGPDAILVPLLAADPRGNRLGYGKGHYDRTLPLHAAMRIGVAFDCQIVEQVAAEPWDVPLDWLVTPTRTIDCAATRRAVGDARRSR